MEVGGDDLDCRLSAASASMLLQESGGFTALVELTLWRESRFGNNITPVTGAPENKPSANLSSRRRQLVKSGKSKRRIPYSLIDPLTDLGILISNFKFYSLNLLHTN